MSKKITDKTEALAAPFRNSENTMIQMNNLSFLT